MTNTTTPAPKFAVQAAAFSEAIHVGRVSRAGDSFAEKEEATDMVLAAVAQYVEQHFAGGMQTDFPGLGLALEVKVTRIPDEPTEG